jgi:hypothetical protein
MAMSSALICVRVMSAMFCYVILSGAKDLYYRTSLDSSLHPAVAGLVQNDTTQEVFDIHPN